MPKFIIERTFPPAGSLSPRQLAELSQESLGVLRELGTGVQWVHSYVVADKFYCVYNAADPEIIREHARRGSFPIDSVTEVKAVIDPTTAER